MFQTVFTFNFEISSSVHFINRCIFWCFLKNFRLEAIHLRNTLVCFKDSECKYAIFSRGPLPRPQTSSFLLTFASQIGVPKLSPGYVITGYAQWTLLCIYDLGILSSLWRYSDCVQKFNHHKNYKALEQMRNCAKTGLRESQEK